MTRDEALAEAVTGERVRAVDMPEGVYIDYQFNGWRINFPGGSSSGYTLKPHDETVEWEVYVKPAPVGWDMSRVITRTIEPPLRSQPKRRGRKAWVPPAEINDIDDAKPSDLAAWNDVIEANAAKATAITETGKQILAETIKFNPWAEAGLTSEPKPATGWADYGKGGNGD